MKVHHPTKSEELMKAKGIIDCFIKSCSHNLKSPLTSIEGLLMISEYYTNPAEVNHCLSLIQQCTLNMLNTIRNLEEYTLLQQHELDSETIPADKLIERVLTEYEEEIAQQEITVSTNVSKSSLWISDEYCNYLILKNLVKNAIHFNDDRKKSKKIDIKVSIEKQKIFLEVSDNGIGIAEAEKEKIFEPFHRSSNQSKGSGLGLFLVKGAIEKLNAKITVRSAEHLGTSFLICANNNLAA